MNKIAAHIGRMRFRGICKLFPFYLMTADSMVLFENCISKRTKKTTDNRF